MAGGGGAPADGAADVVVELAVDAEVEALARAGLAHGEGAARLEPLLLKHRRGEADVGEPRDHGRRTVEVRGTRNRRHDGGGDVLQHAAHGIGRGVLAGDEGGGTKGALGLGLEGADLGLELLSRHVFGLGEDVVDFLSLKGSEGGSSIVL